MGDADDTYDFRQIPEFLAELKGGQSSSPAAATSAGAIGHHLSSPVVRQSGADAVLNRLFGTRYTDVYCGFRAFSRET